MEFSVKTADSRSQIVRLSMSDLKKIEGFNADLVMLIGCETADGPLYRGTGIAGLHQGFLMLGAQNVFGNLWEVDASMAIGLAQKFLDSWASDHNGAEALRKSKISTIKELRRNAYFLKPHPYFWGSSIILTSLRS